MTAAQPSAYWLWSVPLISLLLAFCLWWFDANVSVFLALNHLSQFTGELLWANLTIFGDGLVALVLSLAFAGRRPRLIWIVALSGLVVTLFIHSLKPLFDSLRPPGVLPHELFTLIGPAYTSASFPSGHTATIFALTGAILLAFSVTERRRQATAWLCFALLVGLSRILAGVHWPLDVAVGAALGWLAAVIGWWLAEHWHWGESRNGQIWLNSILVLCALALLILHNTHYPQAYWLQKLLALACLGGALWLPWQRLNACFQPQQRKISLRDGKIPTLRMMCCLRRSFAKT